MDLGTASSSEIMTPARGYPASLIVVVTGASAGLGRAIVQRFAKRGARIGLIARGLDRLEATQNEVEALGGEALVLPADVADASAIEAAAEQVEASWGRSTSG